MGATGMWRRLSRRWLRRQPTLETGLGALPRRCAARPRASARPGNGSDAFARRRPTMSRAYRIRVRESLTRVVRAHDQVSTQLELLEVLPREELADMLARELESRGVRREGRTVVRAGRGVTVEVELDK